MSQNITHFFSRLYHYYSGGDFCEAVGKYRITEVKLKWVWNVFKELRYDYFNVYLFLINMLINIYPPFS